MLKTYTDVRKDACKEEFERFGACLRTAVSFSYVLSTLVISNLTCEVDEEEVVNPMKEFSIIAGIYTLSNPHNTLIHPSYV